MIQKGVFLGKTTYFVMLKAEVIVAEELFYVN